MEYHGNSEESEIEKKASWERERQKEGEREREEGEDEAGRLTQSGRRPR